MRTYYISLGELQELEEIDVQSPICIGRDDHGICTDALIMGTRNGQLIAGWWKDGEGSLDIQWHNVTDVVIPKIWDYF
jgi:hypothetical protein